MGVEPSGEMGAAESTVRHLFSAVASHQLMRRSLKVELFNHFKLLLWEARKPWQHVAPPQSSRASSSQNAWQATSAPRQEHRAFGLQHSFAEKGPPQSAQSFTKLLSTLQVTSEAIALHDQVIRANLARYGGYEVTTEGDAFIMAFHDAADAMAWCM